MGRGLLGGMPGRYTGFINVAPLGLAWGDAPFCINLVPKGLTLKPLLAPSVSIIKASVTTWKRPFLVILVYQKVQFVPILSGVK